MKKNNTIQNVVFDETRGKYCCTFKGEARRFILCLPEGFEQKSSEEKQIVPLILMLHGAGGDSEAFRNDTGFDNLACKKNYAVVYVDGTSKKGYLPGWFYFDDKLSKDDAAFLCQLVEYLQKEYNLNNQTFVAGFSNGAFMVNKLAAQYSEYFTAAASVAGMMSSAVWENRDEVVDIGFLQINGTKDDVVPMRRNNSHQYNPNPAMEDVIDYFTSANVYTENSQEQKVKWILVEEGRHSWPDGTVTDVNANAEILKFFDGFRPENHFPAEPELLYVFKQAYPDLGFESRYDREVEDWKITVTHKGKTYDFYWNKGSLLPPEEMSAKDDYSSLLYPYAYKKPLKDPATYTDEEIARIKEYGKTSNRKSEAGTPMFFFDVVYDSFTRASLEKQIKSVKFLGFKVNIHKRLVEPLERVEARINEAAKTDDEVTKFINNINRNEGYYWRVIANTNRKSFHSLGIAIDITPKSYRGKEVYWSWARDKSPDNWMLIRLSGRWMPPEAVIEAFEEEGFIWGGKWVIWDNMHFEYHPELIIYNDNSDNK